MNEQILYLIRGWPGSGKTTLAKSICYYYGALHFETDDYFCNEVRYSFIAAKLEECHKKCQADVEFCLSCKKSACISNTFIHKWEMKPYLEMATKYNVKVAQYICNNDFDNAHVVPSSKVAKMKSEFEF